MQLSPVEIFLILLVALLIFGPKDFRLNRVTFM
jgi:Sec-independent protein translocase protein TatA